MKTPEIRKLVGKEITWHDRPDVYRGWFRDYCGIVLEVKNRNVLVDRNGCEDWCWLPSMYDIKVKPSGTEPPTEGPQETNQGA